MFGSYYIATLFGLVFFGHQVGAFLGAWMGGVVFDRTLSYEPMWWLCALLSAFAALINLPVDERPIAMLRTPAPAVPA
jgi:predicted MFS family arabinose efflux permease